jgi:pantoate--beta-alanine ligase
MQTIRDAAGLRAARNFWRFGKETVAFVPTMGNLHEGHLDLVRQARARAERVVVSVFVNPMQFDREDDLRAYPRTLEQDARRLESAGVDVLFAPDESVIYPRGVEASVYVEVPGLGTILEGASRPGHFRGVATVVAKLFNLVQPHLAFFGEKDFQQLLLIRRMVEDLGFPVEIVSVPTRREADGLAMSSRNGYLSPDERARAPLLYRALQEVAGALRAGADDYPILERRALRRLERGGFRPEYVTVRRRSDLAEPTPEDRELVVLGAAWLGRARLIDNLAVDRRRAAAGASGGGARP